MRRPTLSIALRILSAAISPDCLLAEESAGETRFEFADGLIWVEVTIPDRSERLHFVFDTGAGATVLNLEVARELGLSLGRAVHVQGTQGRARAYRVDRFRGTLANAPLPKRVLAIDLDRVIQLCHRRIDGLIGADFLADRVVQLDFAARTLRLDSAWKEIPAHGIAVRLEQRNDAWCVPARVNGRSREWIRLDTGYDGALCWWPGAADLTHSLEGRAMRVRTTGLSTTRSQPASTQPSNSALAELHLSLGNTRMGTVQTALLPRRLFAGEHGLLGNAMLSSFRVTIDVSHNRLVLERTAP